MHSYTYISQKKKGNTVLVEFRHFVSHLFLTNLFGKMAVILTEDLK